MQAHGPGNALELDRPDRRERHCRTVGGIDHRLADDHLAGSRVRGDPCRDTDRPRSAASGPVKTFTDPTSNGTARVPAEQAAMTGETAMVGARGFEPPTPWPPAKCAARLRHAPTDASSLRHTDPRQTTRP